ncbi:MAG: GNAT family N-acetyltransferase [Chloroflexota bacterium]
MGYSGEWCPFSSGEGNLTDNINRVLTWVEITNMQHPLLNQVQLIYESSFVEAERREFHDLVSRYSDRTVEHAGYLYALIQDAQVVGITAFSVFARTSMIHLSIIATRQNQRKRGLGGVLMDFTINNGQVWLADRRQSCLGMVWEVERIEASPTETERAIRQKRVAFYEHSGGHLIGDFTLPPLRPGQQALDLTVMYRPPPANMPMPITEIVETVCREAYDLPDNHPAYLSIRQTWEQRKP